MDVLDWFCMVVVLFLAAIMVFLMAAAFELRDTRIEVQRTNAILERLVP